MAHFVLVHGAMHGAWCWDPVVPLLEADARSAEVIAIDLPGHGELRDAKPLSEITLDDYVAHVVREIEARDLHDVVLVGHSLAGLTLPPVCHRVPSRIAQVIYLAASIPEKGRCVNDLMGHPLSPISRGISTETMFCNDLDAETSEWLLSNLCEEPSDLMERPVETNQVPIGIATTYVVLGRDETLPPDLQREQAGAGAVDELVDFDSGHSAFAAKPRELAELLLGYA